MKLLPYLKYLLLLLSAGLVLVVMMTPDMTVKAVALKSESLTLMLTWAAIVTILTIVLALVMPIIPLISNPKSAIKSGISLLVIVGLFLITYAMGSTEPVIKADGTIVTNVFDLKITDMALHTTYFAFAALLVSIVVTEIYKAFK